MEMTFSEAKTQFKSLPVKKQIDIIAEFIKFFMLMDYFLCQDSETVQESVLR